MADYSSVDINEIDLDGDGVISEAEIAKAIEFANKASEAEEKDKKGRYRKRNGQPYKAKRSERN